MPNRFEFTDEDGDKLTCRPMHGGVRYIVLKTDPNGCAVSVDRVEEVIAGIRDMARQAGGAPERVRVHLDLGAAAEGAIRDMIRRTGQHGPEEAGA